MDRLAFKKIQQMATQPEAFSRTIEYVAGNLRQFIRRQERVLICFSKREECGIAEIMERSVRVSGGIPMHWGPDYRWKALLRQAFSSRATVIIGPPLVILGLVKLARSTKTPLFVRNVLTVGAYCPDWMKDGIQNGLDCRVWECYALGYSPVIGGFTCKCGDVHLRAEAYTFEIVDDGGEALPEGSVGNVILSSKQEPQVRYLTSERGRLRGESCACGDKTPRLTDILPGSGMDPELVKLTAELLAWNSILDCRLLRGSYGLEVEIVVFPGEKLPRLPSCAKQVLRPWDPEADMPFSLVPGWKNSENPWENH